MDSPLVELRDLLARRYTHGPARLYCPVRGGRPQRRRVVLRARAPEREPLGDTRDCGAPEALPVRNASHDRCADRSLSWTGPSLKLEAGPADDDDAAPSGPDAQPELGSIAVKLAYVTRLGRVGFKSSADLLQPGVVHERSKKMGVQCVS